MSTPNPYAPPRGAVEDIPDQNDGLVLASRMSRLGAAFLDGVIGMVMIYVPMFIGVMVSGGRFEGEQDPNVVVVGTIFGLGGLLGLVGLIVFAVLTVQSEIRNRQTLAKRIFGIKVVRRDGSQVTLGRLFWLRNVVNAVLGIIPLYGLVDFLFIFGDHRQCLHDKLADTIVVNA